MARRPDGARLALVEAPPALGPSTRARMRRADRNLEAVARESLFSDLADGAALPPLLVEGIVAGIEHVLRVRLLNGRERELPQLAEGLAEWTLCHCSGSLEALSQLSRTPADGSIAQRGANGAAANRDGEAFGDERALVLAAVERLAAEGGYGQLTVARIRATAGVSRRSFDAHFTGVSDCFLAAYELRARRALERAARAGADAGSWQGSVHRTLAALCAHIARRPAHAALALAGTVAAGREGMRCRERLTAIAADHLRESVPPAQRPTELAAEASAGAIWGMLEHHVGAWRAGRLRQLPPTLSLLALAPAIGAPAAVEAIQGEELRMRGGRAGHPSGLARSERRAEPGGNGNRHRGV